MDGWTFGPGPAEDALVDERHSAAARVQGREDLLRALPEGRLRWVAASEVNSYQTTGTGT